MILSFLSLESGSLDRDNNASNTSSGMVAGPSSAEKVMTIERTSFKISPLHI